MRRRTDEVTEAELGVLEVLWDRGTATIREISEANYRDTVPGHCATVQKLLERLERKGFVGRDRESFAHRFTAAVGRSELVGSSLRRVADKLCEGSLTPLLMHLTEAVELSREDRERLRDWIDASEKETAAPSARRGAGARNSARNGNSTASGIKSQRRRKE